MIKLVISMLLLLTKSYARTDETFVKHPFILRNKTISTSQTLLSKRAILIVDVQEDFTGENARMAVDKKQAETMIKNINTIIENNQKEKEPMEIIYIGNEFSRFDIANLFRNYAGVKGNEGVTMDKRLRIASANYFSKKKGDAFSNWELCKYIEEHQIKEVLICGLFAGGCVLATVKGALKNDLTVAILEDGVAAKTDESRCNAIKKYKKLKVKITLTKNYLAAFEKQ